ncbi:MAG: FAD-dependent oxidoreductase [Firmicutes bacterium]|nr:FAD-dependent oxidoreductase [Bacillota bacterium]
MARFAQHLFLGVFLCLFLVLVIIGHKKPPYVVGLVSVVKITYDLLFPLNQMIDRNNFICYSINRDCILRRRLIQVFKMPSSKRVLVLVLIFILVLSLIGCSNEENQGGEQPEISFTPGTLTGKGVGFNGEIVLDVTFSEDAITDIELISSNETAHVSTPAFDIMFDYIKSHTSTGIDLVSGATLTSNAILRAVEDAALQAGCDIDNLRTGRVPFELTAGEKITDTFDVVVVGGGGAGMTAAAAAAQNGATVVIIEKETNLGGNTLVSGCSMQGVIEALVWDVNDPDATTGFYEPTGETYDKIKSDQGRIETLRTILNWSEKSFDEAITDSDAVETVSDYNLPDRGVHPEYLETLKKLKEQISDYLKWAEPKLAAGATESELTVFSTVELHIFQTYYGGLRLNNDKTEWIYSDYDLVYSMCHGAEPTKVWFEDQGSLFNNESGAGTLIGCMWQRIIRWAGAEVNGEVHEDRWGTYFAVPLNTVLSANDKNTVMYRTKATDLVTDSNGRITGVKAVQFDGTEVEITAELGVILATGGYAHNIDMVMNTNEYWKNLSPNIKTTNRSLAMGEGITMAEAVGAVTTGMGYTQLMPIGWANTGHLAGGTGETVIFISPAGTENAGKRFVNESAERDVLAQGAFDHGGENGLFIQLSNGGDRTSENNRPGREYFCTLEEAAEMLEIDTDTIKNTIIEYDEAVRSGALDKLDVPKSTATREIGNYNEDGTFNEEGMLSVRYLAPSTHHTMGGLVIDTARRVLNSDGEIIEGLYAAGEVTGGFHAGNRLGGNAISDIIVSGKIAGESVTSQ